MASTWTGFQQPEQGRSWKSSEVCIPEQNLDKFGTKYDEVFANLCQLIYLRPQILVTNLNSEKPAVGFTNIAHLKHLKALNRFERYVGTGYWFSGWGTLMMLLACNLLKKVSVFLGITGSKTNTHCGCCTRHMPSQMKCYWSAIFKTNRRKGVTKQGFHLVVPSFKRNHFFEICLVCFSIFPLSSAFPWDVFPKMLCFACSLSGNVDVFLP